MRRAALLHEAFSVYMRSTAVATGLPIPTFFSDTSSTKDVPRNTMENQKINPFLIQDGNESSKVVDKTGITLPEKDC